MVAVVSGNGLGLFNTSLTSLGGLQGGLASLGGRAGAQVVNITNGNLILQDQDENLSIRGFNTGVFRTYNSRGTVAGAGQDGFVTGYERRLSLTSGTLNVPTSQMTLTTGDGQTQVFTYSSANTYISTAGEGAHDTLVWNSGSLTWTMTEGSSRREERYANHANTGLLGRLTRIRDLKSDGITPAQFDVIYSDNTATARITEIRSIDDQATVALRDAILFGYDGSNRLSSITTREGGVTKSQVSYGYDAQSRLSWVQQDLTPTIAGDATWDAVTVANNNNLRFRTNYTYLNVTDLLIASITQSDGTTASYTYELTGNRRVLSVTQGSASDGSAQTVNFSYNANSTDVTDSLGRIWTYQYDADKQLTAILAPAVGGQRAITSYTYTTSADTSGAGNVSQVKVESGGVLLSQVNYTFDTNGNVLTQWTRLNGTNNDSAAVVWTYTANNQIATETRYTGIDTDGLTSTLPSGGLTSNFVYDGQNRLLYSVDPSGLVTQRNYASTGNGIGQMISTRVITGASYSGSFDKTSLDNWTAVQIANSQLTEFTYDVKGRLQQSVSFASVNPSTGVGVTADVANDITSYAYDAQGLLLQKIVVRGAARTTTYTATPPSTSEVSTYVYDGMGRLLSVLKRDFASALTDALTVSTTYAYTDSARQIVVTLDSGATRTENRNLAGQTTTMALAGNGQTTRITQNFFDGAGQLRGSQDASGARRYFFYDAKGRLEAEVDATGAVTKYNYDGADRRLSTVQYANRVTTTTWLTGSTVNKALFADIGVVADTNNDRTSVNTFDAAGRVLTTTDGDAANANRQITTYTYDGAGRVTLVRTTDSVGTAASARETRQFYDNAGRLVATLDAERYLVRTTYDAAGRIIQTTRSAGKIVAPATIDATTLLSTLTIPLDAVNDQTTRYFYNGRGQQIGTLDAQGYLTEAIVDEVGNTRAERRYATAVAWATGDTLSTLRNKVPNNTLPTSYRESKSAYNGLGQLFAQTNYEGSVTKFTYDEAGRLVRTQAAEATTEVREGFKRYNIFDELIGETTGEQVTQAVASLGGKLLTDATLTETQLNNAYNAFGVTHSYDAMSRRIESIDAQGNKTFYFYDSQGRQSFVVKGVAQDNAGVTGLKNSYGEVAETRYNAFGQVTDSLSYTGRIAIASPYDRASVQSAINVLSFVAATDTRRQFMYDQRGLLKQSINALNVSSTYNYTAFGQLNQETRASATSAALSIQYGYDKRGLQIARNEDMGLPGQVRSISQTFDAFGRVISSADARGAITNVTYDRLGRQITRRLNVTSEGVSRPETTTMAYDAFSQTVSMTDALNNTTNYVYNDTNRSLVVISPEGVVVTTVHNRHGQTLTVSQVLPDTTTATTTYTYDKNGFLRTVTNALNQTTSYDPDVRGLLYETTDATGRKVRYSYDAVGRVLSRSDDPAGLNLITTTSFDGQGRQVKVTDASGRVTTMSYDQEGRLLQTAQDPSGLNLRTSYTYDAAGRQVTVTEGVGTSPARTTQYVYDVLGRRTQERVDANGLNLTTNYLYDANDNVVQRTDATGNVSRFVYDEANRRIYDINATGGVSKTTYDKNGQVIAVRSYATAIVVSDLSTTIGVTADAIKSKVNLVANEAIDQINYRVLDRDNRESFSITNLSSTTASISEQRYDSAGRASQSLAYAAAFTDAAALAKIKAGTAVFTDFTSYVTANEAAAQRQSSVYDAAGRLRFSVDALGNVTEQRYDAAGRVMQSLAYVTALTDSTLLGKIKAGTALVAEFTTFITANDATAQRQSHVYDAANRLVAKIDGLGNTETYQYDAAGRRTATTDANGKTSYSVYDVAGRLTYSIDTSGAYTRYWYDTLNRVAATRRFNAQFTPAQLGTTLTVGALDGLLQWQSIDQGEYRVYDSAGRLRLSVDLASGLQEYTYDASGRLTSTKRYANSIAVLSTPILNKLLAGTASIDEIKALVTADNTHDIRSHSLYDAAGRMIFSINGKGEATRYWYDATGKVSATVRFTNTINMTTFNASTTIDSVQNQLSWTNAQGDYQIYDTAGRVCYTYTSLGNVQEFIYDANGRVVLTRRFAQPYWISGDTQARLLTGLATEADFSGFATDQRATAQVLNNVYDSEGRLRYTVNALGEVTENSYDAVGQLVATSHYGNRIAMPTNGYSSESAVKSALIAAGGDSRVSNYVYDVQGRLRYTLTRPSNGNSSVWVVSERRYDALGQLKSEIGYAKTITLSVAPTESNVVSALGAVSEAERRVTQHVYDNIGRLRFTIDDAGYVKEQRYDSLGQVSHSISYNTLLSANVPLTQTDIANAVVGASGRQVRAVYDSAGRLVQSIDALNQSEYFSYDSLGNNVSKTDKLGNVWTYEYDAAGRQVVERSPQVSVSRYDNAGNIVSGLRSIVTRINYDVFGNVIERIENADTAEARSIQYQYDAMNRQIKTVFPDAGTVGFNGQFTFSGTQPYIQVSYNARGEATVQRDVRGVYTYKIYNHVGQVAYEVDAEGNVSENIYNAYGEQATLRRYANKVSVSALNALGWSEGGSISLSQMLSSGVLSADPVNDRVITTQYDARGLKISVQQSAIVFYDQNGQQGVGLLSPTSVFEYNAFGELVKESVQLDASNWAYTHHYYDDLGRKTLSVDAEGYLTSWQYNAQAEVTRMIEHARAINPSSITTTAPPSLPSVGDVSVGLDRSVSYSYDALGRKISETSNRRFANTNGTYGTRDVLSSIEYDAMSRVTGTTVDGVITRLGYDALGRNTSLRESERQALLNSADTALQSTTGIDLSSAQLYQYVSPYTSMQMDAFGNVLQVRRYANGADSQGNAVQSAADAVTQMRYDRQGRMVWESDAEGTARINKYDAAENVTEQQYYLVQNNGRRDLVVSNFTYDKTGRQLSTTTKRLHEIFVGGTYQAIADDVATSTINEAQTWDAAERVTYNGFGEIITKTHDGISGSMLFEYDKAGRVLRNNSEGGVMRNYGYNLAGAQNFQSYQVATDSSTLVNLVTRQQLDRLGRTSVTTMPAASTNSAETKAVRQRYDRWGNVLEVIDPRGYQTNYQYNQFNKIIREERPLVLVVSETGVQTWQRPVSEWFYDAQGRELGSKDANGNMRMVTLDSAGRVIANRNAINQVTLTAYDALGRARMTQSPLGYITFQNYDRMDRVNGVGDYLRSTDGLSRTKQLREQYVLDVNGRRKQVIDALGNTTRYDYDSRGLLVRSQTAMGVVMGYGYDVLGNKIRETNALSDPRLLDGMRPVYNGGLPDSLMTVAGQPFSFVLPENFVSVVGGEALNIQIRAYSNGYVNGMYTTLISNEITYDVVTRTLSGTPTTSTDVVFTVTLPSTGAQVEFRTSIGVVTSVATWYVGSPQIKRGILNPAPNAGGAWSMQVPADTFADPTNQALTYTGKIGYWVNDVIEYDAESGGYFVSERAHWAYRDTTAADWVQFDVSTRTFSTRAGYSVPPGNWQLMIIATDTDAKATGLEIRGFGKNPNPRVSVTDSEENELSYLHEQTWDYDVFGRVTDYNDLGGLDYDYQYSAAGNMLSQNAGALAATPTALRTFYNRYNSQTGEFEYIPEVVPSVATNQRQIKYFANGQIREIREGNNVYTYAYDSSGNRVLEQSLNYDSNGVALHVATRMTYDSNNRLQRVVQDDLSLNKRLLDLWYDYDAVGNRRRVVADGAFAAGAANIPMNNTAPYLVAPVGDRTLRSNVSANFSVLLSNIFRDRELDTLGLDIKQVVSGSETTLPGWLSYTLDDNGRLRFFANGSSQNVGDVTVRLKVTDGVNLTPVMTEFVIHVVTNSAPVALLGTPPEFVARFDRDFLLELPVEKYFRDIDVNDSISLSLGGSLPSWITVDTSNPAVVRLSGRPTSANAGVFSFNLVAADELGAVTNQAMSIRVRANNVPAVAKTLNPIIKFTDRLMAWQEALPDVFTDADSDELNVTATLADGSPLPTWLNFRVDYVGGVPQLKLIGVPPSTYLDNTQIIVKLTAADGQNSISTNLSVTIRLNQAPQTIATISALDSKINKDFYREFAVAGLFSDANGDVLNYRISTTAPTSDWLRLTYDSNRGVVILSGRPPATATGNFSVALSAVDPSGAVATYSIPLAVRGDTAPQYVNGINNQTIYTSRNFTFTLPSTGFNDADGDQLNYEAWAMVWFPGTPGRAGEPGDPAGWIEGPLPTWLNFNAVTRTFSGVAPAGTSTTKILIGVTDETGKWASKDFDLSVALFTNTAPQYNNNLVAQNATEGAAVDIALPNGAFTDVNSDLLTYSAQILIGSTWVNFPQIGLNINAATGRITGTPSGLTQGSYSVRIFASDGPASANGTFTLTVNRKPVAPNSQTLAVIEGVAFNHQLIGYSDPEGTALTYTATKSDGTALPAWLTVSSSGQVSGTPPVGFVGLGLSIRVQDASGLFNYSTFTINVNNPPPQYVAGSVPATLSLPGNVAWSYQVPSNAFTNQPVAEVVTYSAKWNGGALPAWLSFNANPASRTFSGTPPIGTNGTLSIYVTDMAGGVAATNISFSAWNAAPQYNNTLGNQNFNQGAAVDLLLPTNTFTDANQEALTYTAFVERPAYSYEVLIPGTELEPQYNTINVPAAWYSLASSGLSLSINSSTGRITGTANVLNENQFSWTNYRIKIVAKDASNTQAEGIFSLNINQAPVLPAPTNFTVGAKTSFSRALTNAYDPDGTALTFSATGLPAGVTINSSNGTLSGTAPVAGSYVITVYASDGVVVSSTTITLVAQNYAPVLNASIGNQNLNINTAWNFTVAANTFIDTNGDTLTYSASGLPAGIGFNAATRTFSGTQTTSGVYTITLSVSDGIASPVSTTFTLNVINPSVNNPPQTSGIPDFSVVSGAGLRLYDIKPYFTDPNGDTLTYSQVGAPSWFVFNASTGVFSGSASGTLSNQWTITVTANDNRGGTISTSFTLYKEGSGGGGGQLPQSMPTSTSASLSTTANFNDATDEFGRDFEYTGPVPVWDTEAVSETQQSFSLASLANQYEDGGGLIDAPGGNGQVGTPVNTNTANAKGYWFTYDAENRMLVANGSLINNQIHIINQDISYLLSYNEGGQATARIVLNQSGLVTETSQFTERGELRYVIKGGTVMESRDYDAAGRLSNRKEYFAQSHTLATYNGASTWQQSWATTGWLKHEERYFYDKDGRTTLQQGFGRVWNWTIDTRVSIADQVNAVAYLSAVEYNNAYDNAGRLIRYRYQSVANEFLSGANAQSPSNYAHTYVMSYQLGSNYQEHQVWGFSNNTNFKASVSTSQYDAWGRRVAVREQTPGADPKKVKDRVRYYHYDAEGGILQRREGIINNGAFSQVETINNQTTNYQLRDTRYTYANGQQVARQTKDGEFSVAGGPSIRDSVGNPLAGYNMGLYAGRSIVSAAYRGMVNQRVGTGLADATLLAAKAREQQDMQKAIAKGQAEAPGAMDLWAGYGGKGQGLSKVQVQPGETLQSFAQRVYGNSSMWYLIAEANGLASGESLIGGTMLSVPDAQVTKNDASTFKPYNPMEAIGNTAPDMPYIPPPPKAGCGGVAMIIMAVIAIAVSVFVPVLAPVLGPLLGVGATAAAAIATGVVTFAAHAVSTAVASAVGLASFSWRASISEGVVAGLTYGIGSKFGSVGQALKDGLFAKAAALAVTNHAVGYVGAKIAGTDASFSWKAIAASMVTSAITTAIQPAIGKAFNLEKASGQFGNDLANGFLNNVVSTHVRRKFGFNDPINYGQMAVDAFGNTLANALTGKHEKWAATEVRGREFKESLQKKLEENKAKISTYLEGLDAKRDSLPKQDRDNPLFLILGDDVSAETKRTLWRDYKQGKIQFNTKLATGLNDAFGEFVPDGLGKGEGSINLNGELVEMAGSSGPLSKLAGAVLIQTYWEEQGHQLDEMARSSSMGGQGVDSSNDEGALFAYLMAKEALAANDGEMNFSIGLSDGSSLSAATNSTMMKIASNYTLSSGRIFADSRDSTTGRETYGPEGHYFTTGLVALEVARRMNIQNPERVAAKLALWSQIPDMVESLDAKAQFMKRGTPFGDMTSPNNLFFSFSKEDLGDIQKVFTEIHNLAPKGKGTATWLQNSRRGARNLIIESMKKGDYALAGMTIHKLGDSYAHSKNGIPFEMPGGHGLDSILGFVLPTDPDILSRRQTLAQTYAYDLAATLAAGFGAERSQLASLAKSGTDVWRSTYEAAIKAGYKTSYGKAGPTTYFVPEDADAAFRSAASNYLRENFSRGDLLNDDQIETYHPLLPPWDNRYRPGLPSALMGSDTPWGVHDRLLSAFGVPSVWHNRSGHEIPPTSPWYSKPENQRMYWTPYNFLTGERLNVPKN